MTEKNLFEMATRKKFRFASDRGELTTEQLWDLPLDGKFSLNAVAKSVNTELKLLSEENFVQTRRSPRQSDLEAMLETVKHVISVRLAENEAKLVADAKAERKKKLLSALERQEEQAMLSMSADQIRKELEGLA